MKPPTRVHARALSRLLVLPIAPGVPAPSRRAIHSSPLIPAHVAPFCATGPPPDPPVPAAEHPNAKIARRRKQAELLKNAQALRKASGPQSESAKTSTPLRRRFWQNVLVEEVDGSYQIRLDARPLRHPTNKTIIAIPLSKPHLAHALALEWDLLASAQQATKQHLVPLTSLVCRALDIAAADAAADTSHSSSSQRSGGFSTIRTAIATTLLRYLDTDSLLCWAPPPDAAHSDGEGSPSLRELQEHTAGEIVRYLTSRVWPGVEIEPVLDEGSIMPRGQKPGVREVIQGWVMCLDSWDLAGLERAALAGKGLLGAARLVVEWSEGSAALAAREWEGSDVEPAQGRPSVRFGVEEAAKAASLEVDWQTGRWGEVEDTHDVEREDLRRQLGGVVLLVSGTGSRN